MKLKLKQKKTQKTQESNQKVDLEIRKEINDRVVEILLKKADMFQDPEIIKLATKLKSFRET